MPSLGDAPRAQLCTRVYTLVYTQVHKCVHTCTLPPSPYGGKRGEYRVVYASLPRASEGEMLVEERRS